VAGTAGASNAPVVTHVRPWAEAAGIRVGDQILAVDGEPVPPSPLSFAPLYPLVPRYEAGGRVTLTLKRDEEILSVSLRLWTGARPRLPPARTSVLPQGSRGTDTMETSTLNNAYEADATEVHVMLTDEEVRVSDDGAGMDLEGLREYGPSSSPAPKAQAARAQAHPRCRRPAGSNWRGRRDLLSRSFRARWPGGVSRRPHHLHQKDHPLYVRQSRKKEIHTLHLTRLLAQEISLMKEPRSPRQAFERQSKLLRDASIDDEVAC